MAEVYSERHAASDDVALHRAERVETRGPRPPYETRRGPSRLVMVSVAVVLFALAVIALLLMVY